MALNSCENAKKMMEHDKKKKNFSAFSRVDYKVYPV